MEENVHLLKKVRDAIINGNVSLAEKTLFSNQDIVQKRQFLEEHYYI